MCDMFYLREIFDARDTFLEKNGLHALQFQPFFVTFVK